MQNVEHAMQQVAGNMSLLFGVSAACSVLNMESEGLDLRPPLQDCSKSPFSALPSALLVDRTILLLKEWRRGFYAYCSRFCRRTQFMV